LTKWNRIPRRRVEGTIPVSVCMMTTMMRVRKQGPTMKAKTEQGDNKKLTRTSSEESNCGGKDHKHISLLKCPWKGQSQEEVAQNYVHRLK
jgi:hypothetical protein